MPPRRRSMVAILAVAFASAIGVTVVAPHSGVIPAAGQHGATSALGPSFGPTTPPASSPPPGTEISADIVVYGATPSGILAAVSAARLGASVALVTPEAQVGGMMTSGLDHADVGQPLLIGGLTRAVFDRIARAEKARGARAPAAGWNAEPHVAAAVFSTLLSEAHVAVYLDLHLDRTGPPELDGNRIVAIRMTDGTRFRGSSFIDASYEGDLMAAAGVPWTIGRESVTTYGEPLAGVHVGDPDAVAADLVSGVDLVGQAVPGAEAGAVVAGSADGLVQAATYRLCVTDVGSNRRPFTEPPGYDPSAYVLVGRSIAIDRQLTGGPPRLSTFLSFERLPGGKADLNSHGLYSTDLVGGNDGWATADDGARRAIAERHRAWVSGLLWYLGTDPGVPAPIRRSMARWGLCADEFRATGGWPPELYVREARRMVGSVVLTQQDLQVDVTQPGAIALGTYRIDAHYVRRVLGADGLVRGDGQLSAPTAPYEIPYAAIVAPAGSVDNLLVSVAISASHVAWSSVRTEPTLMEIGEAAGVAAALAARDGIGVREVPTTDIRSGLLANGAILSVPGGRRRAP